MPTSRGGGRRRTTRKKTRGKGKPPVVSVRSGYLEIAQWESDGGRGPTIKLQKRIPPRDDEGGEWRDMGSMWLFPNEVEENLTELIDTFLEKMVVD